MFKFAVRDFIPPLPFLATHPARSRPDFCGRKSFALHSACDTEIVHVNGRAFSFVEPSCASSAYNLLVNIISIGKHAIVTSSGFDSVANESDKVISDEFFFAFVGAKWYRVSSVSVFFEDALRAHAIIDDIANDNTIMFFAA